MMKKMMNRLIPSSDLSSHSKVFASLGVAAMTVGAAITMGTFVANTAFAKEAKFAFYFYFQEPEEFLQEHFGASPPPPAVLQLDGAKKAAVNAVFERDFPEPRVRYWSADGYTAWIFDDLGKKGYQPTTSAFLVKDGEIIASRVLTYRESRGQEVGEEFFLEQLKGARAQGKGLTQEVDNITGATESVYMMQRMARTAIEFDSLVE